MADGEFHIVQLQDQYHVVFRPDVDPQWFRIVASFYNWERAYHYWDVERVMSWEGESGVDDDERESPSLVEPPTLDDTNPQGEGGLPELVRNIYEGGEHVPEEPLPAPFEDEGRTYRFEDDHTKLGSAHLASEKLIKDTLDSIDEWWTEHPYGLPASFFEKQWKITPREAWNLIAALMESGEGRVIHRVDTSGALYVSTDHKPPPMRMTPKQEAVYRHLLGIANAEGRATATYSALGEAAGVQSGSVVALLDSLAKKNIVRIVGRGSSGTVFEVRREEEK